MDVLDHAELTNQVVVTSNHDMILLCVERRQSVIWIDARGRQLRREECVLLVFKSVSDWVELFETAEGPVCLRAMRTKTVTLALDDAARLVRSRMARIAPARKRAKPPRPLGPLLAVDESESPND